jgi:putative hydrolase
MSTPFGPDFGMDPESLGDAPLFRELQRVMAAGGGGPVNWELARQVGVAAAAEAGADPEPTDADRTAFAEALRLAELHVTSATGIDPPAQMAETVVLRRATWVADAATELRAYIEPAATRMTEALERAIRDQLPPEAAGMSGMIGQIGPLLQGSQVGQILGAESASAFGGYHVPVPRTDPAKVVFVPGTIASTARRWSIDEAELRTWAAIHEVAHRISLAHPWIRPHLTEQIDAFLSTLTIDVEAIAERLASLQPGDPDAVQDVLGGDGDIPFGAVLDDEQRIKLARIQASVGAAEGWAEHVTDVVARAVLGSHERIDEALRRRDLDEAEPVFTRLLAVPIERRVFDVGRRFCDVVVERTDEATLARMWEHAEAMPSFPELEEPTLWLSRTV